MKTLIILLVALVFVSTFLYLHGRQNKAFSMQGQDNFENYVNTNTKAPETTNNAIVNMKF